MIRSALRRLRDGIESDENRSQETPERAGLFACPDCGDTYISTHLDECPSCRAPVRPVQTERDLGYE